LEACFSEANQTCVAIRLHSLAQVDQDVSIPVGVRRLDSHSPQMLEKRNTGFLAQLFDLEENIDALRPYNPVSK
jgi:hypothetical protein